MGERVLFVHAHPDDETLSTGIAIATLSAQGKRAGVLTLTMGEAGEVRSEVADAVAELGLPAVREQELSAALAALGAESIAPMERFPDSGMSWAQDGRATHALNVAETALSVRPLSDVVEVITDAIESFVPTAIVTYGADGGYGHPDHRRAHVATLRAAQPYAIPVYVIDREATDVVVQAAPVETAVRAALDVYRTQFSVEGDTITHVGGQTEPVPTEERFQRLDLMAKLGPVTIGLIAVLGLVVGVVGTFTHQSNPPYGALIAALAAAGIIIGPRLLGSVGGAVAGGLGVILATVFLAIDPVGQGPELTDEGLVSFNAAGWIWLVSPIVCLVAAVVWPRSKQRPRVSEAASSAPSQA